MNDADAIKEVYDKLNSVALANGCDVADIAYIYFYEELIDCKHRLDLIVKVLGVLK